MVPKILVAAVAQLILVQSICAQSIGYASTPYGYVSPAATLAASNGPGLVVTSSSPIAPIGISVASENRIEGNLAVVGALPFLGTVGLEGVLSTAGAGNVAYNCGNGAVGITAEDITTAPLGCGTGPLGYRAGPFGYGAGPFGSAAGPLGYGAGVYGYGARPLGFGAGPYGAGTFGYGAIGGCRSRL